MSVISSTQYTYILFPYNASITTNIYIHLLCGTNPGYDLTVLKPQTPKQQLYICVCVCVCVCVCTKCKHYPVISLYIFFFLKIE